MISPATEAVLTMWPSPCSMKRGMKVRVPWMTPQRFTSMTHCHSRSDSSQGARVEPETPALLQTTWAAPKRS